MITSNKDYSKLSIIIPTLNEEKTISILLDKINKIAPETFVIIADDGSKDNTKKYVEDFKGSINVIFLDRKNEKIHGLTISVLDAIFSSKTEYFLVMDGDLQHPVEVIPFFLKELEKENNLVVGNRVEVVGKWPFHRKIMSYSAEVLGKIALFFRGRNQVKDVMSGLFASETKIWKEIISESKNKFTLEGYKVLFDFLKICKRKLRIEHVDYIFGTRDFGESKINKKVIWMYFKSLFK